MDVSRLDGIRQGHTGAGSRGGARGQGEQEKEGGAPGAQ